MINRGISYTPTSQTKPIVGSNRRIEDNDDVYKSTLQTLQNLSASIERKTVTPEHGEQDFANFIAKELSEINNPELLLQANHEITNTIFRIKRQWIESHKNVVFEVVE